jgi:adenylosuccinate synthase
VREEAWVVLDLGFGDAGKGMVTDLLVRARGASLVVRFHGGAQAGHTVCAPDGRQHTFSQFCAGTLAGAEGLLGPDFLLHPLGMAEEARHLEALGVPDPGARTGVDRRARLISPYQQAAGRLREQLRGAAAHGTCGVGVGECAADARAVGEEDTLRAADLREPARLRTLLERQRARKHAELQALGAPALDLFEDGSLVARVVEAWTAVGRRLVLLDPDAVARRIADARRVVFEGAQGALLDEDWGFHPHTTWSDCTARGALALAGGRPLTRLGVLRSYGVRHGAGPFPGEGGMPPLPEAHNGDEGWQGRFRVGALDLVLLRYALAVVGGVDGLALTCLDRLSRGPVVEAYAGPAPPGLARGEGARVEALEPGPPGALDHRARLCAFLRAARPLRAERELREAVSAEVPLWIEGRGPRADQARWIWPTMPG